jgi:hypothetical protein
MSERPLELILLACFLIFFEVIIVRAFYQIWFQFPEFQQNLIKRNERYARSGWPFASWANKWIANPSYKWFARVHILLMFLMVLIGLWSVLVNLLLRISLAFTSA